MKTILETLYEYPVTSFLISCLILFVIEVIKAPTIKDDSDI